VFQVGLLAKLSTKQRDADEVSRGREIFEKKRLIFFDNRVETVILKPTF
jgi:hypothetical protein